MNSLHKLSDDLAWSLLNRVPDLGPVHMEKLLQHMESVQDLLGAIAQGLPGLSPRCRDFLSKTPWGELEREARWLESADCYLLHFQHPDYPPLLKQIAACPPVIYVQGDLNCLSQRQLAIVGSRNPSTWGRRLARDFARDLARCGYIITSGLAMGIDTAAHEGCLAAPAPTVAVLGTGLDRVYPTKNKDLAERVRQAGALVSEFPIGTVAKPHHFPRRNRIISGLTIGTIVVEAGIRSGSLITARYAADQAREVFAFPGSVNNPLAKGCHELIRQGAKLVENLQHILEEFPKQASLEFTSNTGREPGYDRVVEYNDILKYLGYEPTPVDLIIERSGLPSEEVSSQLLELELQGSVQTIPGGLYVRVK